DFQSFALPTELRHQSLKLRLQIYSIFIIHKTKRYKNCFCKFTSFILTMNLIIDIGNTFVKLAVFQESILKDKAVAPIDVFEKSFKKILKSYPKIQKCIMSSVGKLEI